MDICIVFDLDGVLLDSRELHYQALNMALAEVDKKYVISKKDQIRIYEGLTTKIKLDTLSNLKDLPRDKHRDIWLSKQRHSANLLKEVSVDTELVGLFKKIKENGIRIGVASNSIRETLDTALQALGVLEYVDIALSNEDVVSPKPSPEIYLKTIKLLSSEPESAVIFEDSRVGKTAALASGSRVISVKDRSDLTNEKIDLAIESLRAKKPILNIVIPMAGSGSRFSVAGYLDPKPLIKIFNAPMIERVVSSLDLQGNYIYIVQKSHYENYKLEEELNRITPNCTIIQIDGITEGAAITSLYAKKHINNDSPLVIANSDQILEWDGKAFVESAVISGAAGSIAVFTASASKWSYVEPGPENTVLSVAEKRVISDLASVGVYFWLTGKDYVKYTEQMVDKNIKTNGEYYICPVYNELIEDGGLVSFFPVEKMHGVGTPEDLEDYLRVKNIT